MRELTDEDILSAFAAIPDPKRAIITRRYKALIEKEQWLQALEDEGVDKWEGLEGAQERYERKTSAVSNTL